MINPYHSRPLDVHRWSDHPEVNQLVDHIWAEHFSDLDARGSGSGPKPKTRFKDQLKVLLLDLYVAWVTDPTLTIGVSMSPNSWRAGSRYNALHISKKIIVLIQRLVNLGLLELSKGSYSGPGAPTNRTSRIWAADPLRELFAEVRFELPDIHIAKDRETVILRTDDETTGRSSLVEYEDTDHTRHMRGFLERYNACLADSFIDLPHLEFPYIERQITTGPREGKVQRVPVGPSNAFVRRVFSRGSWDLNGRFYGGWWQQIDKASRALIHIDDEPTVELDFRGLHVAILSKEKGVLLEGDPYWLPSGLLPDVSDEDQRDYVKYLILTAINARDERTAFSAFRDGYPAGSRGKKLTNNELKGLHRTFVDKHPHLDDCLCSDQGIRLMNVDSQIAENILSYFTDQWKPILCIHDSFIINYSRAKELKSIMQETTTQYLGGPLPVTQEGEVPEQPVGETRGYRHRRDKFYKNKE